MPHPKSSKPPKPKRPDPVPRILAICPHCSKPVPEPVLGPLAKYKTPSELEMAIQIAAEECVSKNIKFTLSRLAYELGFASRQSMYDLEDRLSESKHAFAYVIKRAKLLIETLMVEGLTEGKAVQTSGIMFYLKNMDGWKDVKDIREEHSGTYTITITQGDPAPRPALTKGGKGGSDNPGGSMIECQVVDIVDDAK